MSDELDETHDPRPQVRARTLKGRLQILKDSFLRQEGALSELKNIIEKVYGGNDKAPDDILMREESLTGLFKKTKYAMWKTVEEIESLGIEHNQSYVTYISINNEFEEAIDAALNFDIFDVYIGGFLECTLKIPKTTLKEHNKMLESIKG